MLKIIISLLMLFPLLFANDNIDVALDSKKPNILVVHSWHDILWDRLWCKGISNTLAKDYNLIRFDLDAMRLSSKELQQRASYAFELAQKYDAVGVILGDDMALKYAGPLFEGTKYPIVYLGINFSPRKYLDYSKASNITGVLERPLYKTSLKKILKLFDKTEPKILLLSDSPLGDEDVIDLAKIFSKSSTVKIFNSTLEFQVQDSWEKWQQAVKDAPKNGFDVIMIGSRYILRDKNGNYIEPETGVLSWMNKNSKIPFFGFNEDGIGKDFHLGGWVLGGVEHGEKAGNIMLSILQKGTHPSDINPLYDDDGKYIFCKKLIDSYRITIPKEIQNQVEYIEDRHDLWDFTLHPKNDINTTCKKK